VSRPSPRGRRKQHHEEESEGGGERWLVTYADMLTLLLVLFIVLYAMSIVDTTKFVQLRAGLAAVFNPGSNAVSSSSGAITASDDGGSSSSDDVVPQLMPSPSSTTILDQQVAAEAASQEAAKDRAAAQAQGDRVQSEVDEFKQIEAAITTSLASQGLTGSAQFTIDERGLVITIVTDTLVFGGNSATLLAGGTKILDSVTPPLLKFPNAVEVDGHTNQQNVSTAPYPSGWELSSARASSVVRYLISKFNFPESRLSAVGFSDQKPLYPPSDPRSVTLNRRVDVVVLSTLSAADRALLPAVGGQPVQ
jgi:chemotaxis protein MotB